MVKLSVGLIQTIENFPCRLDQQYWKRWRGLSEKPIVILVRSGGCFWNEEKSQLCFWGKEKRFGLNLPCVELKDVAHGRYQYHSLVNRRRCHLCIRDALLMQRSGLENYTFSDFCRLVRVIRTWMTNVVYYFAFQEAVPLDPNRMYGMAE